MRTTVLHLAAITGAVFAVFSNALSNGLYFDDQYLVLSNPEIREVFPIWRHFIDPQTISALPRIVQYRPLLPLTLSFSYLLGGLDPAAYHVGNLLCHLAACWLIYALTRELVGRWSPIAVTESSAGCLALVVALACAVHPVSGFLINYISARDLLLMQAFLLGSLLTYVRMRRVGFTVLGWVVSLALLVLALFSKTDAAVAPVLVLLFELTVGRQRLLTAQPWLRSAPFAAAVGLHYAFERFVLGFSELTNAVDLTGSPWSYARIQAKVHVFEYLRNFFWPFYIRLTPRMDVAATLLDPGVLLGLVVLVGSLLLAHRFRTRRPLIAFCILAYWLLLAPSSSVVRLFYDIAHYRPYPAMPFLFLGVAVAVFSSSKPRMRVVTSIVLLAFFATSAYALNRTWRTAESAWSHSIRHGGHSVAHMNYALALGDRTDPRVLWHMQEAVRLSPNHALALLNLGLLRIDLGQPDAGIELAEQAVRLAPGWAQVHYWLAVAYSRIGRDDRALTPGLEAVRLDPRNDEYLFSAADLLQRAGRFEACLDYVGRIDARSSRHAAALFLEGLALQRLGRDAQAIAVYESRLARDGGDAQTHFNLAYALMKAGRYAEAVDHFERALVLRPDYREAHQHLAFCLEGLGRTEQAAVHRRMLERME